ncbi:hypothetical protein ACFFUT_09720 [Pseudohalocynthiibacter aestuariivivens]|jgi:hypothetical protein|uniref:Uncharacterized protein n=1 Tax=Pseudohalocynthiibacter aestuariivivens TaxID=1591409 RepID=A0ABV5JH31_9RHOB|nr:MULTISPECIES: hypothetical protein [Pseudohalocynthiibacter]MBS9717902.1 hypothetical protein [Pseudohalocynthiibacter aestuariivivens]MCK0102949.1 hypothetical protein [Pseudohalocynthiibacter sp. F2068]
MPQNDTKDPEEILATVSVSPMRRYFAMGVLIVLGTMLIYIAFDKPPANFGWQVFLLALGTTVLFVAEKLRRATSLELELTQTELRESSGRVLAYVDDIVTIDRGVFAFKPSNGFMLKLNKPMERVWATGLWWRIGRRVGVGGVTSASQGKSMAEILTALTIQKLEAKEEL